MNTVALPNTDSEIFLLDALHRLPQARHFTDEQAKTWLTAMRARETHGAAGSGLTLTQHIRRLGGFGASEIGRLVGERRGQYSPFGTARELVMEKLLQRLPDPGDEHTHRGVVMEPLIRQEFLRQSGAVRRIDLAQQIAAHTPARWPWMRATPDDLVEIQGALGIVDYKAPAEPLTEVSLAYACQLHQIGLLAHDLGIPLQFQALVAWNHRRGLPEVFLCEHDPQLEQDLLAAGDEGWNQFVLNGACPDWPVREPLALTLANLSTATKTEIEALAERYLRLDALAKAAKSQTDEARAHLLAHCHARHLAETVASGPVRIKPQAAWNVEAIESRLDPTERARFARPQWETQTLVNLVRDLGGNPEVARRGDPATDPLDLDAAAQWLMDAQGIPEAELRETVYKSSISRAKAHETVLESVRTEAIGLTETFSRALTAESAPRDALPVTSPSPPWAAVRSTEPSLPSPHRVPSSPTP